MFAVLKPAGVIASLAQFLAGPVLWPGGIFKPWAALVGATWASMARLLG